MDQMPAPQMPRWLEALVPYDRYAVGIENHRLHVMESGVGRPVLCLHGNPTWGFLYRKVANELRGDRFRVVMPDLVGLGWSTHPTHVQAHTLENHARWIGKLIDRMELEDWILVVQDWGGPIGLLAAERAEHPPAGIVLLNTVVGPPKPGFKPTAFHSFSQTPILSEFAFRILGFPQVALWAAQGDKRTMRGKVADAYKVPLSGLSRNAAPLALARMVPDSSEHPSIEPLGRAQAYLESFAGPRTAVWGERDPILGSVVRWVEKLFPEMRIVHTNAGHFLQEEVPGPIADAIRRIDRQLDSDEI